MIPEPGETSSTSAEKPATLLGPTYNGPHEDEVGEARASGSGNKRLFHTIGVPGMPIPHVPAAKDRSALRPLDYMYPPASLADGEEWGLVYARLKEYDSNLINSYTADMDTLLIFAGLFSAVLTTLVTTTYAQLQPDNGQISADILGQIYFQVANISAGRLVLNSTLPPSFTPSSSIVTVNTLWFLSLIFSLAAALLAIFVKQWLREYILWTTISPVRQAVELRQYRFEAFQSWHVPATVTALPVLLQVALLLFFGGLLNLLWTINHTVFGVSSAAALITASCTIYWTIMPLISARCPYKTPLSWALLNLGRVTYRSLIRLRNSSRSRYYQKRDLMYNKLVLFKMYMQVHIEPLLPMSLISPYSSEPRDRAPETQLTSQDPLSTGNAAIASTTVDSGGNEAHPTQPLPNNTLVMYFEHDPLRFIEYDHHDWARRDLAAGLITQGDDSLEAAARTCRPLLWAASYNEMDPAVLLRCATDCFNTSNGPLVPDVGKTIQRSIENPHRRMCAYWMAICQHLGYPPQKGVLPLLRSVESVGRVELRHSYAVFVEGDALFRQLHRQLGTLNANSRRMIFRLLCHGVHFALDCGHVALPSGDGPFSDEDLQRMYLSSLYMMRILCHRGSELHPDYFALLCRVLTSGSVLHWDHSGHDPLPDDMYGPVACIRLMDNVTAHLGIIECPPSKLFSVLDAAINFSHPSTHMEYRRFWSVSNSALALQLGPRTDTALVHQHQSVLRLLLEKINESLLRAPEAHLHRGWNPELHQLWTRLPVFCEQNLYLVPPSLSDFMRAVSFDAGSLKKYFGRTVSRHTYPPPPPPPPPPPSQFPPTEETIPDVRRSFCSEDYQERLDLPTDSSSEEDIEVIPRLNTPRHEVESSILAPQQAVQEQGDLSEPSEEDIETVALPDVLHNNAQPVESMSIAQGPIHSERHSVPFPEPVSEYIGPWDHISTWGDRPHGDHGADDTETTSRHYINDAQGLPGSLHGLPTPIDGWTSAPGLEMWGSMNPDLHMSRRPARRPFRSILNAGIVLQRVFA